MIASFNAELLKLRKRPATWILLGVVLGLTQLFGYLLPYSSWVTSDQNFQTQGLNPQAVLAGTLPGELVPTSLGGFPVFAGALALILAAAGFVSHDLFQERRQIEEQIEKNTDRAVNQQLSEIEAAYGAVDLATGTGLALKVLDGAPRARGAARAARSRTRLINANSST